jgi:hypothetical protein
MTACTECGCKDEPTAKLVNGRSYCASCEKAIYQVSYNFSNPNRHADYQAWLTARRKEVAPRLLTLAQLKLQCRNKNLAVSGTKRALIERLRGNNEAK